MDAFQRFAAYNFDADAVFQVQESGGERERPSD